MTDRSDGRDPSVADLGGEDTVFALTASADGIDMYTAAVAVCDSWTTLHNTARAAAWLQDAVRALGDAELIDFNDRVLSAPATLPALARPLETAWNALGDDATLRGNVALEGWTRLALGGWATSTLALRSALAGRAGKAARGDASADVYLVRSISAALDQWPDHELEAALAALAVFDDLESDVAFELGMAQLRKAVVDTDRHPAATALAAARHRFDQACLEGDRPDAIAFSAACQCVTAFLVGEPFSSELVERIESAAHDWVLGYLGEAPHWRQPRSATAAAWAALVADLQRVRDLDAPGWVDPTMLLTAVGRLYSAHNSSALLARPNLLHSPDQPPPPEPGGEAAAWLIIGARLDTALANPDRLWLINRWVTDMTARLELAALDGDRNGDDKGDSDLRVAVDALHAAHVRLLGSPPGKGEASPEDDGIPTELREAVLAERGPEAYDMLRTQLRRVDGDRIDLAHVIPAVSQAVPLADELTITNLLKNLQAIRPADTQRWALPLMTVLNALVRIVRQTINHTQSGQRRYPWNNWIETTGGRPPEHTLADHLASSIELISGYPTHVEVPNVGGGRADVLMTIHNEQFVIEVKRVTVSTSNDALVASFGDQAAQYTLTGPPFAFLAALDLTQWTSRLALDESFWVAAWTPPNGGEPRPLVGLRVLANADTPSTLSA